VPGCGLDDRGLTVSKEKNSFFIPKLPERVWDSHNLVLKAYQGFYSRE